MGAAILEASLPDSRGGVSGVPVGGAAGPGEARPEAGSEAGEVEPEVGVSPTSRGVHQSGSWGTESRTLEMRGNGCQGWRKGKE